MQVQRLRVLSLQVCALHCFSVRRNAVTARCKGLVDSKRPRRRQGCVLPSCISRNPTYTCASARADLPKSFNFGEAEPQIYARWQQQGCFQPDAASQETPFTMCMPPPNVTGRLHMGHAITTTLQDIMARYQRMRGRPVLWLPGTDHAGIATQMVVEKLLAQEGVSRQELGREEFEKRVWGWKEQYGGFITQQMCSLGASCDWSRERFTLDQGLSEAVQEAFVQLHEKGLVYRGSYLVNWSPNLQTAVSDLEVEYAEEPGKLFHFRYPIADSDDHIPVATTRPETILGDTAVAVHPEDDRYKHLVGKMCQVPMTNRLIPVIADSYVEREFGTGALKITPGHDPNDYEIGKRCDLELINIMGDDGSMNANAGPYEGLDRFVARKKLWADMKDAGLVIKEEPYTMRVPRSQRGGEVVEPLVREQWFVRMESLAKPALQAVEDGSLQIVPARFIKTWSMWLENIRDWCISRQLWWGHRIPVWYAFQDEAAADAAPGGRGDDYIVARNQQEALQQAQQRFGEGVVLRQDPDVLDTWFSSGLWPFSTLGWPDQNAPDLQRFYPTNTLETGHDILFFWVARMVMMGIELTGQSPFSTVYLHGLVRDEQGRKMSKSLGNVVDPVEIIQSHSCDALRFTLATGTTAGQDLNLSMDRVVSSRNFCNKLWNAGKFILMNLQNVDQERWHSLETADFSQPESLQELPLTERWILSATHQVVDEVTAAQERLDFGAVGRLIYDFFWNQFADWYIEAAKVRLYSQDASQASAQEVLVYAFRTVLALAHPLMPFITEELWGALPHRGPALMVAQWPSHTHAIDAAALDQFKVLQDLVRGIRNSRAEYGVDLGMRIPATLVIEDDALRELLQQELPVISSLSKLDESASVEAPQSHSVASNGSASSGQSVTVVISPGAQVRLPLAGLFDAEKELQRLAKQESKIAADLE
ncbi:hypothetical protein WJX84_007187, partial [Apatococcus fuscideae]